MTNKPQSDMPSNIKNITKAIRDYAGYDLDIGTLRSLKMIDDEDDRLKQSHLAALADLEAKHKESTDKWRNAMDSMERKHREEMQLQREAFLVQLDGKQAKIDMLMEEYCPEEMTEDQERIWSINQVRISEAEEAILNARIEESHE